MVTLGKIGERYLHKLRSRRLACCCLYPVDDSLPVHLCLDGIPVAGGCRHLERNASAERAVGEAVGNILRSHRHIIGHLGNRCIKRHELFTGIELHNRLRSLFSNVDGVNERLVGFRVIRIGGIDIPIEHIVLVGIAEARDERFEARDFKRRYQLRHLELGIKRHEFAVTRYAVHHTVCLTVCHRTQQRVAALETTHCLENRRRRGIGPCPNRIPARIESETIDVAVGIVKRGDVEDRTH